MTIAPADLSNYALAAAFRLTGPAFSTRLAARLRGETLRLLESESPLPRHFANKVIASGDSESLKALAAASTERPNTSLRLAKLGDPALAVALYSQTTGWLADAYNEVRRAVLDGAAKTLDDPGWYADGGLVPHLLASEHADILGPTVLGPFPELIRHTLTKIHDEPLHEKHLIVLLACTELVRHGEADQLPHIAKLPGWTPQLRHTLLQAATATNPAKELETAWAEESSLARRLHDYSTYGIRDIPVLAPLSFPPDVPVDWDAILAEHQREPYHSRTFEKLVAQPDCPPDVLLAAHRAHESICLYTTNPLPWEVLAATKWTGEKSGSLMGLLDRGVPEWFPVDRVLSEAKPALHILNELPYHREQVSEAVGELARSLGADAAAWRAIHTLLPRFQGSCTELVNAALAQAPKHHGKPWPKPADAQIPAKYPDGYRAAVLHLFAHAPHDIQHTLTPHLDQRAVQQLLIFHHPSPKLRTHIINVHGPQAHITMAAHRDLSQEQLDYLLALDNPQVNAMLYHQANLSNTQKWHLLAGRTHQPGRTEPVPLSEEMIDVLTSYSGDSNSRSDLLPICESGHPQLIRLMLGTAKLHTRASQLLLVVRLWERHGAREVQALLDEATFPKRRTSTHPLPATFRAEVAEALHAPDGLAIMRQRLNDEWSPQGRIAYLRSKPVNRSAERGNEAIEHLQEEVAEQLPWQELLSAHHHDPLPDPLLVALGKRDDCPDGLKAASHAAQLRVDLKVAARTSSERRPCAVDLLRNHAIKDPTWITNALAWGQLTPLDILTTAKPAHLTASVLLDLGQEHNWAPVFREARQLAQHHLGDNLEAWVIAIKLLPDFAGTIPELLATAEVMTG